MDALKRQRRRQLEQRIAAGDKWAEDDISRGLVFRQTKGKAHSELSIFYATKEAGKAIGLPELHPHDLRHSYAVVSIENGDDIKTVQTNLGHATSSFTLDVYGHVSQRMHQQSAERMERFIQSVTG